ncbi:glycosyltransferase family 4 protein [Candidatus Chloroploca asiatica]|uniref:Uncharacterized protein n=1 Tax=Candidatus Chloroploca asiatica TaxID=1506545 RepID=A0A2H3LC24_9CHLR|nr:glycosyltransferase family 4 protein [Candidatus Chloroploca asiatica]PDV99974.1 hypothetical protein A9Q02_11105 [Candidatus Chloroploca asiatica]
MPSPKTAVTHSSVCMLVTSDLHLDPRVQKEAKSASDAGFDVTVVCRSYTGTPLPYKVIQFAAKRRTSRLAKLVERTLSNLEMIRIATVMRPDIVHANDLDTLPAGYLISRLTGAKLVYDSHEYWPEAGRDIGRAKKIVGYLESFLIRRCNATVTVNRLIAEMLAERYKIPLPTVVMNAPLSVNSSEDENNLESVGIQTVQVLHLGMFHRNRGLEDVVRSARYMDSNIHLTFIGSGDVEQDLRSIATVEGLEDKVSFLPPVASNQVVSTASRYDIGLIMYLPHNLNNQLASPNKLFEYVMAGLALVAPDLPIFREVVNTHQVGVLCEPGNPVAIAAAVNQIARDPETMAAMKRRSLVARKSYTWDSEGEKLLKVYRQLLLPT